MTDPVQVLTERLTTAMEAVAPEAIGTDPVIRPSDRADFQANGIMGLAKRLNTNPRDLAQQVLDRVDLDGIATAEIAGPGFLNLNLDTQFLGSAIGGAVGGGAIGHAGCRHVNRDPGKPCAATGGHRLLGAKRGQGNACGPPAVDGDRRCAGAHP